MSDLFPDFRDPLFGILIIIITIFIISFITYSFGLYKERNARKEYRKLLKRFEIGTLKEDDFIHLYTTYNLPFDSILLLASTFLQKGNYTKAISVYLALLGVVKDNIKKEELLELLGTAYFKGGFLQRSKDIYLKILKFAPRNKVALKYLLIIFEKLKEFDRAKEILTVLDELDCETTLERIYISTLQLLYDPTIEFEIKASNLLDKFKHNTKVERFVITFLIKFNKPLLWKNIDKFQISNFIDLLWYLEFEDVDFTTVNNHTILQELYTAKGYIDTATTSDIFELAVLISTKQSTSKVNASLNFEFMCNQCKKTHPIYESRCPHCNNILTFIVEPKLAKASLNLASLV